MPKPYSHLLRISNTNINYIMELLHDHHQRLRSEDLADYVATSTSSVPIAIIPAAMTTLSPYAILSNTLGYLSNFLSTFPSNMTMEETTSVPYYEPNDSPSDESSIFPKISLPAIISLGNTLVPNSYLSDYPSPDMSSFSYIFPFYLPLEETISDITSEPNESPSGYP